MDLERNSESKGGGEGKTWQSCCVTADKNAMVFFSQLFVCIFTMSFCMYQLITLESCEAQSLYYIIHHKQ